MMGSDSRGSWNNKPSGVRNNNWNPTPPTSPANQTGWNSSNSGGAPRTNNWSSGNQGGGNWSAQPSDEALWSAAPGFSTGPVRRPRSNSDSWGSPAAPARDAWESIPGWSSRPENNTGWSGAAPPPTYSTPAAAGPSWSSNPRGNDGWGNGAPTPPASGGNSRWAPAGWDPLPPPKAVSGAAGANPSAAPSGNWDGKRPSVDRTPAPAPPKPAVASAGPTNSTPATSIPVPAPAADKAVSFEISQEVSGDKDPRGRDGSRPTRGRGGGVAGGGGSGGGYYARDRTAADQSNAMRKSKSTSGLDRKYRPDDQAAPAGPPGTGKPSGRLFTRQMDEVNRSLGVAKDASAAPTDDKLRRKQVTTRDASKALGVIIYGFPQGVQVKQFIDIFGEFGTIVNVSLVGKPKRHERAYAYVDYETPGCAAKAVEALKTRKFFDMTRPLEVRLSFNNASAPASGPSGPSSASVGPPTSVDGRKGSDGNRPAVAAAAAAVAAVAAAAAAAKEAKEAKEAKKGASAQVTAPAVGASRDKEKDRKVEDKDAVDLRTIHLANVPSNIDKSDVEKVFGIHGDIRRIQIVQKPKEKRAYAFVSYKDEVSCRKALASIKDAVYFDMSEPLKAEYAKQQNPDKKRKAIDKPWKKGEALEKRERNDQKKREGGQEKKGDSSAQPQRRKSGAGTPVQQQRTVIFISSVPGEFASEGALRAKLGEYGTILSIYVVSRHDPASTAQFALVTFEKGEDASKVIAAKVLTCVFPRQRRVVVRGIPLSAGEAEVKAFFAPLGEVRRVEKFEKDDGTEQGWLIEFVRPEAAARSLVKAVEDKFGDAVIKAEYAPSTGTRSAAAKDGGAAGAATGGEEKAVNGGEDDDEEDGEYGGGDGADEEDESSSDDEEAVIVVEEEEVKVEEGEAATVAKEG